MTLDAYLSTPGAHSLTKLAAEAGVSKSRLSQLRESKNWPPDLALRIEDATAGALSASELSPIIAQARTSQPEAA